jgi:hypothetical protein
MPDVDYVLPNGREVEDVCVHCRAGYHASCSHIYADNAMDFFYDDEACCCGETYSATQHGLAIMKAEFKARDEAGADVEDGPGPAPTGKPKPKKRGNSGYIHPEAWPDESDIGTLKEPQSTGRKRVKRMLPIPQGTVCEWAGLARAGGGVKPIVGCVGYPAQDIHHGPDKNTLNNAKQSQGIGTLENVHWICSFCHNTWHAANDPYYPRTSKDPEDLTLRNYVRDQATPFVPQDPELEIHAHDPQTKAETPRVYDLTKGRGREGKPVRSDEEWDDDDDGE